MAIIDLKNQITGLVRLQELDSEIYALGNERAAKPQEIKAMGAAFELKKQDLAALEKKSLDLQKQRKEKELELATNAEGVKKLSAQLFSLKTNKEFQVMQQQIADAKADGAVIEEKILISFEESDKIKAQIDSENLKLKCEEKIFLQQKKVVELRSEEIGGRLSQLDAQRKQIIPGIDPRMLQEYERILHSRDGLAIVPVKDNSCGGCHMSVPPQVINLIKMYEHIITCEVCNRILYITE
ncbi:MAG: C4-type zinc ribbon domain-containing protein [Candidatus Omnitrophota bacterium]|nr:C4-type zinc ribbon domain-containing protein [Candidatus Omnitrophota bacterium]